MRLVRPVNGNTVCRDEGALDGFVSWVDTVNARSALPSWIGWPPASTTVAETPPLPGVLLNRIAKDLKCHHTAVKRIVDAAGMHRQTELAAVS
jgi:hypothetical protein